MNNDFALRRVSWGMSTAEVEAAEGAPTHRLDNGVLAYSAQLAGSNATLFYTFVSDALVSAGYYFDEPNDVDDVATHERLRELLSRKYGPPRTNVDHRTPYQMEFPETFGALAKAVARGELEIVSIWETGGTRISLALQEDKNSYNAFVALLYTSPDRAAEDFSADMELI